MVSRRRFGAGFAVVARCGLVAAVVALAACGDANESGAPPAATPVKPVRPPERHPRHRSTDEPADAATRTGTKSSVPDGEAPRPLTVSAQQWNERAQLVETRVFAVMDELVRAKAAETLVASPAAKDATPPAGSLAAARQWAGRDLFLALWTRVGADAALTPADLDKCWKARPKRDVRTMSYGTGSFLVVAKQASADPAAAPEKPLPPLEPGADEAWWRASPVDERANWLLANVAETSGMFEILKVSVDACPTCSGTGIVTPDASTRPRRCPVCNGAGGVRTVSYR